jgi:hypothetical protein
MQEDTEFCWFFKHDNEWQEYSAEDSQKIETAFTRQQKTVKIAKDTTVSLTKKIETKGKRKRSIKRDVRKRIKLDPIAEAKKLLTLLSDESNDTEAIKLSTALRNYIFEAEYVPPKIKPRVEMKGVSADEAFHITSQLDHGPISTWTQEQLNNTIDFVRGVGTYFMRGTTQAREYLSRFLKEWDEFLSTNPKVKEAVDPVTIVFDVDWTAPNNLALSVGKANHNLGGNTLQSAPIPAAPQNDLPNVPAVPQGGSNMVYITGGDVSAATHFGGYVAGANHSHIRGYWCINSNVAPVYY